MEYRTHLFWKLNGAAFVDAGNVWTIRNREMQPEGLFKFNRFYKQLAVAYGLGLRFDLDFLIIRFDGGMKLSIRCTPDATVIRLFLLTSSATSRFILQ